MVYHRRALQAAADLVGTDRLLFGTNHPLFKDKSGDIFATVDEAFRDDPPARDAVAGGNAAAFFGLPLG